MGAPRVRDTTQLLNRYGRGEKGVEAQLLAAVYQELHQLAASHMRDQAASHTLQPTALIHEAWLRLVRQEELEFDGRAQFFQLASKIMRSVLVDHARQARREKRGGGRRRLSLDTSAGAGEHGTGSDELDLLALEEGLQRLEEIEPGLCRVVEMRFFGGLSHPEIARATGTSLRTVERNWRLARAWLQSNLSR